MRPRITLKAAISLDGFLDDTSNNRRVFSSPEDLLAVDALRAQCDAILIGARTVREDDPGLLLKNSDLIESRRQAGKPEQPLAIVLSSSAVFDLSSKIFQRSPILCLPEALRDKLDPELLSSCTALFFKGESVALPDLLSVLSERGVKHLLVEGGNQVLSRFFVSGLFDELRLSVAPLVLGSNGSSRLSLSDKKESKENPRLVSTENLGGNVVHIYRPPV